MFNASARDQTSYRVWCQVRNKVRDKVRNKVSFQVNEQVWDEVWTGIGDQAWFLIKEQMSDG